MLLLYAAIRRSKRWQKSDAANHTTPRPRRRTFLSKTKKGRKEGLASRGEGPSVYTIIRNVSSFLPSPLFFFFSFLKNKTKQSYSFVRKTTFFSEKPILISCPENNESLYHTISHHIASRTYYKHKYFQYGLDTRNNSNCNIHPGQKGQRCNDNFVPEKRTTNNKMGPSPFSLFCLR